MERRHTEKHEQRITYRTPKKYPKKPGRIKLTKVQAAAVTFMTKEESKAFREHLTLQKQNLK
jgi:hypothetical protein